MKEKMGEWIEMLEGNGEFECAILIRMDYLAEVSKKRQLKSNTSLRG